MCLIIYKPKDVEISVNTLWRSHLRNGDGWGILARDPDNTEHPFALVKGIGKWNKFLKRYNKIKNKELLIHFRIKTSGLINKENCHPFRIIDNIYMAHNGVLDIDTPKDSLSDTGHLAEKMAESLKDNKGLVHDKTFLKVLEEKVGWSNKLVLMDENGPEIVNEARGVWKDGAWYSNSYTLDVYPAASTYDAEDWGDSYEYYHHRPGYNYNRFPNLEAAIRSHDNTGEADLTSDYTIFGDATGVAVLLEELQKIASVIGLKRLCMNKPGRVSHVLWHLLDLYSFPDIKERLLTKYGIRRYPISEHIYLPKGSDSDSGAESGGDCSACDGVSSEVGDL